MSLIEVMLHNKLIILSIGVSGLLLALAVALAIAVRVRAVLQKRQAKRTSAAPPLIEAVAAPASIPVPVPPPMPTKPAAAPKPVTPPTPQPQQEEEVSSALKTLVANAFVDDEVTARRNALLNGLEDVDIHQLNKLCGQVLESLRTRSGAAA
jgi:type IV secretory pathway VirB10-like protein